MKGLDNLGNTCYFNCALQCLLQTPQLSNFLILRNYSGNCNFTKEYQSLVRNVWLKGRGTLNPERILQLFRDLCAQFKTCDQHDSQEAFLCLLDILDKSLRPFNNKKDHSLIREVFYSTMVQETVYKDGKSLKYEQSPMTILYEGSSLEEAMTKHQNWSVLEGFKDDNNVVHHVATTRTMFWTTPNVLAITFRMYGNKYHVKIPELFDLKPFVHENSQKENTKYQLFASCKHHGSIHSGHYVAYTKHKEKWYIKNDGFCTESPFPETDYHYFVLYKRVNSSQ